jgi:hypothetical protein
MSRKQTRVSWGECAGLMDGDDDAAPASHQQEVVPDVNDTQLHGKSKKQKTSAATKPPIPSPPPPPTFTPPATDAGRPATASAPIRRSGRLQARSYNISLGNGSGSTCETQPRPMVQAKMTKWLKSAMRCASSEDLLSLAYDMTVPEGSKAPTSSADKQRGHGRPLSGPGCTAHERQI